MAIIIKSKDEREKMWQKYLSTFINICAIIRSWLQQCQLLPFYLGIITPEVVVRERMLCQRRMKLK
jgi:hypothetical protein